MFRCQLNCPMYMLGALYIKLSSIICGNDPTIRQVVADNRIFPAKEIGTGYAFSTTLAVFCCLVRGKPLKLKPKEAGQLPLAGCIGSGLCTVLIQSTIIFRNELPYFILRGCFPVPAAIAFASLGNRLAIKRAARLKE